MVTSYMHVEMAWSAFVPVWDNGEVQKLSQGTQLTFEEPPYNDNGLLFAFLLMVT